MQILAEDDERRLPLSLSVLFPARITNPSAANIFQIASPCMIIYPRHADGTSLRGFPPFSPLLIHFLLGSYEDEEVAMTSQGIQFTPFADQ